MDASGSGLGVRTTGGRKSLLPIGASVLVTRVLMVLALTFKTSEKALEHKITHQLCGVPSAA